MNETPGEPSETVETNPFEQALQSIGTQITDILEATSDGALVLNETGIVYANQAASELWGIPLRELQARGFDWTSLLRATARTRARQVLRAALAGTLPKRTATFAAVTRHLGERYFSASLTPVSGADPMLLAVLYDISGRATSGNEWKRRARLLEEIGRANQMVLSQDLPLSQIRASMEILRQATHANRVCIQVTDGPALESGAETVQVCVGPAADEAQLAVPPRWRTMLSGGLPVQAVTAELPTEERQSLEAQSIQALLALPLVAGEVCRGLIRFDRMSTDVLWSEETIVVLQTGARAWGNALALAELQSALKASEERYRRLVEASPDFIYRMSLPDGRYEYASPAVLAMTGYTAEQFQATPKLILEIIHPGWWNYFETQWVALLEGDMPPTYEYAIIHGKTGETRWLCQRNVLLKNDGGAPMAIEGIVTDITARKRAEMALHAQESMLQNVFRAAPVGIGVVSDRTILQVNDRISELTGYSSQELIGQNARMLYPTEADYNFVGDTKYAQINQQGTGTVETRWRKKDGTIIDILLVSAPLEATDLSAGVTFTAVDITDRKRAEDQMRASLQQRELFLKEVHHSVKSNLAVINSLLELQAMQIDDPRAAELLQKSRDRLYAMVHVHEQLHSSSNVTQVNMEDYINVLVSELATSRVSSVATTVSASGSHLGIEQATLCGLILNELVSNALDHAFPEDRAPDPAPQVTVKLRERDDATELVVEDNGVGMPADIARNHQAALGLDIVMMLAKQLEGQLYVETTQGTRVEVSFPRANKMHGIGSVHRAHTE
ncbi:MAG: PAS domain S-box protein [Anaerolineae bacterium]|nr:PAS domain S-box protein [Anaerolineae bacterium]